MIRRNDRNGMVAAMDAMLFIAILGLTVSVVFVHTQPPAEGISAADVHDDLFRTELRVSDMFDADDHRILPMHDIIALHLITGEGRIGDYVNNVMMSMVPAPHGFSLECVLDGAVMHIGDVAGTASSIHSATVTTVAGTMYTMLSIY